MVGVHRMDLEQFLAELEAPRPKRANSSSQHQDAPLGATLTAAAADTAAAESILMRRTGRLLAKDDLQDRDSADAQTKKLLSLLVTPEKAVEDLPDAQARRRDDASDDVPSVSGSSTINREERLAMARSLRLASDDELLREAMEVSSALTAFSPTPVTAPTSVRRSADHSIAAKDTPGYRQRKPGSSRPSRRYLSDTPHASQILRTSSPLRARGETLAWTAAYGDVEDEDGLSCIPAHTCMPAALSSSLARHHDGSRTRDASPLTPCITNSNITQRIYSRRLCCQRPAQNTCTYVHACTCTYIHHLKKYHNGKANMIIFLCASCSKDDDAVYCSFIDTNFVILGLYHGGRCRRRAAAV